MTILAVLFAWAGYEMRRFARERDTIERLRNAGAEVQTDTAGPQLLRYLLGDDDFQIAKSIKFDHEAGHALRDDQLDDIEHLTDIRRLSIDDAPITDRSLTSLKKHVSLQGLTLRGTKITGSGLVGVPIERLIALDLTESPVDDDAVKLIKNFRSLNTLGLSGTNITDRGLVDMQHLDLVELNLDHTQVTDAGVEAFLSQPHKRLTTLSVSNTFVSIECMHKYRGQVRMNGPPSPNDYHRIARHELAMHGAEIISRHELGRGWWVSFPETWPTTQRDRDLVSLADLDGLDLVTFHGKKIDDDAVCRLPRLRTLPALSFKFTSVSDATLKHLSGLGLDGLTSLSLVDTNVTDVGLQHLAGLKQLRKIDLGITAVTDEGLKHLTILPQLQNLGLARTSVSDTGLKYLYSLGALEEVDLTGTPVTDAGVKELKAALPSLIIIR
jgi:Leucine-rich repeat (LRR) protein